MNQKKLTAKEMVASKRTLVVELNRGSKMGKLVGFKNVVGTWVFYMETPNSLYNVPIGNFFELKNGRHRYAALRKFATEEQLISVMEKA